MDYVTGAKTLDMATGGQGIALPESLQNADGLDVLKYVVQWMVGMMENNSCCCVYQWYKHGKYGSVKTCIS